MQTQQIIEMTIQAGWTGIYSQWVSPTERQHLTVPVTIEQIEAFAKLVAKAKAEELATELEKGPLNDTATSIAIWIRSQE